MGLEANTIARQGSKRYEGKLHLDSKTLTFKGPEFRLSIELSSVSANAKQGLLQIDTGREKVSFEIGEKASHWVEKILNPPTRVKKLGVKPGQKFWLSKGFSKAFSDELESAGAKRTRQIENCELAFWLVTDREQLPELAGLTDQLPAGVNLWIVWTKGSKKIGQTDVMQQAKSTGFGPSKTAAFDDLHSSMRFAQKK